MRILHVTPHLGGGVGKAHAAMAPHIGAEQAFYLLNEPQDRRYIEAIRATDAWVTDAWVFPPDPAVLRLGIEAWADIIQFEYWDHPSLATLLEQPLPPMRAVFWQHKRTMPPPPGRVIYTSELSGQPFINSGFGFDNPSRTRGGSSIAYLGTVNFTKLSPIFFDVMDRVNARVSLYGHVSADVADAVRHMDHPYRIRLDGHTASPQSALRGHGIFFYPLVPDHYGTGENALCEAMSMGLVPVVLDNGPERMIVGDAGIICQDADECVREIAGLIGQPRRLAMLGNRAIERTKSFSPERSASQFSELWASMMDEPKVELQCSRTAASPTSATPNARPTSSDVVRPKRNRLRLGSGAR